MKINKKLFCVFYIILTCCLAVFAAALLPRGDVRTADAASMPAVSRYALPDDIAYLFTDYTCTKLSNENTTMEEIAELKSRYGDSAHTAYLDRAEQIINGNVKYAQPCEFSDEYEGKNKIDQPGDPNANFSKFNLRWTASDLIPTGIYGLTGQEIRVFAESDSNCLPNLIITQNHGYYSGGYRLSLTLNKGMNVFTYPDFVSGSTHINKSEVKGGAIYLSNPYTQDRQGNVKIYIEGGGFYPVFEKGGDETEFLGMLDEYETSRKKDETRLVDMAELITDHTIITTTSSSLYDNYIVRKTISPTLNLELWGKFMTDMLEFNGIATSESSQNDNWQNANNYLNVNFRYMSAVPDSGAYTTTYHIGYYYEHDWFANFYSDNILNQNIYNIVHEVGHQIDTYRRAIDETTNNMTATYAYLALLQKPATPKWQPFERGFNALSSDNSLSTDAFRDGHILYPESNISDRNYMIWWYLESVFPNFWADLNNMYRSDPAPGLNDNEKMVYYSSLVTGVDLSEYYERWGFFKSQSNGYYTKFKRSDVSENFKTLMKDQKIKEEYAHFWLADDAEFDFIRSHATAAESEKEYADVPQIVSVEKSENTRKIVVTNKKSLSHLGYEIYVSTDGSNYKIAGFTYSDTFDDGFDYKGAEPTYKAIAVNRYFKTTDFGNSLSAGQTATADYVCRVNGENFATLGEALYAATKIDAYKGKTIYLTADCHIDKFEFYPALKIEVAPEIHHDITITGGNDYLFKSNYNFNLTGRQDARIIIEGGSLNRNSGALYLGSGEDVFEYVTFKNCNKGGAIQQIYGNVTLKNCRFINCSFKNAGAVYFMNTSGNKTLRIESCEFSGDGTDVCLLNSFNLIFDGSVPEISLEFPHTESGVHIACENFEVSEEDLGKIYFADPLYNASIKNGDIEISLCSFDLEFVGGGTSYKTTIHSRNFVFGSEILEGFDGKKYIAEYYDESGGRSYAAGDEITVTGDKTFNITVKDKLAVNFEYMHTVSTGYFAENESVYLPLFDGDGNKICGWKSSDASFGAGTAFKARQSQTLKADYAGYFRVQFSVNGDIKEYMYQKYGEEIITPSSDSPDFKGWRADGKIIAANSPYTVTKDVTLNAADGDYEFYDLNEAVIEIQEEDFTYTGNAFEPQIKVFINGEELPREMYEVEYADNINAGRATVTVNPRTENATGQKTATFTITARRLSEADVVVSGAENPVYDGTEKSADPAVTWNGKVLKSGSDYDIAYSGERINAGIYEFEILFKGNFSGTVEGSFNILKAQKPEGYPATIHVDYEVKTLDDITPPENFEWVDGDMEISGDNFTALARYIGGDALNYETTEVEIGIVVERETEPDPPEQPDPPVEPEQPEQPDPHESAGDDSRAQTLGIWLGVCIPAALIITAAAIFVIVRRRNRR